MPTAHVTGTPQPAVTTARKDEHVPKPMTDEPPERNSTAIESLPIESVDRETARNGDHVLESAVEVFHEYEQRYDPDKNTILVGPTETEDKPDPYTEYQCSCGAYFTQQLEALAHLVKMSTSPERENACDDPEQSDE